MKGYAIDPVTKTITFHGPDGRTPLVVPDSIPVLLLPTEVSFASHDATYPDVSKGRIFVHTWTAQYSVLAGYFAGETGVCVVSALPGEWSAVTALATAPAGANFFLCQVKLSRVVAPSHTWGPETLVAKPPAGKWISLVTGSLLLEAVQSFSRALSIFVDVEVGSPTFGKLVLHRQQSVADAPGGFGVWGEGEPGALGTPFTYSPHNGGETTHDGVAGYPVYQGPNVAPQYKATGGPTSPFVGVITVPQNHRRTGSDPPSITDPTNYGATWRLDIRGRFGRIFEAP